MGETESKLARCFAAVFPTLVPNKVVLANQENVAEWDSLASLTLLGVINEEFGLALDFEELENFTSFSAICERLNSRVPA